MFFQALKGSAKIVLIFQFPFKKNWSSNLSDHINTLKNLFQTVHDNHTKFSNHIYAKNYSHKLFQLNAYNFQNNPYCPTDIFKFTATTHKSHFQPFTLFLIFHNLRKFWCWTHVNNKDWKHLLLTSHVYAKSKFSIPSSCNIFLVKFKGEKCSSQRRFNIFPNHFQKWKPNKKPWFKNWMWFCNQLSSRN